jgi:hypothetical protein
MTPELEALLSEMSEDARRGAQAWLTHPMSDIVALAASERDRELLAAFESAAVSHWGRLRSEGRPGQTRPPCSYINPSEGLL